MGRPATRCAPGSCFPLLGTPGYRCDASNWSASSWREVMIAGRGGRLAMTLNGAHGLKTLHQLDTVLADVQDIVLEALSDRERATPIRLLGTVG